MENGELSASGKSAYQALTEEEYEAVSFYSIEFFWKMKLLVRRKGSYRELEK